MQVEMSLEELLINAISAGRIDGVQFKRGWSDERKTFDSLRRVIENRLEGARRVCIESALHQFNDEQGPSRMRKAELAVNNLQQRIVELESIAFDGKFIRCAFGAGCQSGSLPGSSFCRQHGGETGAT